VLHTRRYDFDTWAFVLDTGTGLVILMLLAIGLEAPRDTAHQATPVCQDCAAGHSACPQKPSPTDRAT